MLFSEDLERIVWLSVRWIQVTTHTFLNMCFDGSGNLAEEVPSCVGAPRTKILELLTLRDCNNDPVCLTLTKIPF